MIQDIDLKELDTRIQSMKKTAEELNHMAENFPAVFRNTARILASIKMLEMNVSDVVSIEFQNRIDS